MNNQEIILLNKGTMLNYNLIELLGDSDIALILKQFHDWISLNKKNHEENKATVNTYFEDTFWCFQTYKELQKKFSWLSLRTVIRKIKILEDMGILISSNFNKYKMDRTKWYSINYKRLYELYIKTSNNTSVITDTTTTVTDTTTTVTGITNNPTTIKKAKDENNFKKFKIEINCDDESKYILDIINNALIRDEKWKICQKLIYVKNIISELKLLNTEELKLLIDFVTKKFKKQKITSNIKNENAYIKSIFANAIYQKDYLTECIKENINTKNSDRYKSKFINYEQKGLNYDLLRRIEEKSLEDRNKIEEKSLEDRNKIKENCIFSKYMEYEEDSLIYNIAYILMSNKDKFKSEKEFETKFESIIFEVIKDYTKDNMIKIDTEDNMLRIDTKDNKENFNLSQIKIDYLETNHLKYILDSNKYILDNNINIIMPNMEYLRLPF